MTERPRPARILVAEAPLDSPFGFLAYSIARPQTLRPRTSAVADEIGVYSWAASFVIAAKLGIASVAGYALNRQIRLQELRSSTLSTMSHELKTPLASIRVLLDTLPHRNEVPADATP